MASGGASGVSFLDVHQQHELEVTSFLSDDLRRNWQMQWQTRPINPERNYVETAGYHEARTKLWYSGWVTICGNVGDGKSCMAEHLACNFTRGPWTYPEDPNFGPNQARLDVERQKYRKIAIDEENRECYTPVYVESPEDYRHKVDHAEHQVVVIDDIFGHAAFDWSMMERWRPILQDMLWNAAAAYPKTLVIVCVNKAHLERAPGEITQLEWFRDNVMVDLSDSHKPTDSERVELLNASRVHLLPKEEIDRSGHEGATQSVGLVYKMYNQVKSFSMEGQQFFRKPWKFCSKAIEEVYTFDNTLYYTLSLAVLLDGRLDLSRRRLQDYDLHTVQVMEQMVPVLGAPADVGLAQMRFAARMLTGFFFNPVEKWVFEVSHPKVFYMCAQSLCKKNMGTVIELSSWEFIMNYIRAVDGNQARESELVMNCEPRFYAELAKRFTVEISSGRLRTVLQNESCENEEFVKVWFDMLRDSGNLDAILHLKDDVLERSMFYWACYGGNGVLVKKILDVAGQFNLKSDASFRNELIWGMQAACGSPSKLALQAVKCLVEQGVYVNLFENYQGDNAVNVFGLEVCLLMKLEAAPIHTAALRGHPDVVQFLIDNGANMNEATADGYSPLHRATMRRDKHADEVVKVFINNKADINKIGADELTPLDKAVRCGSPGSAEALIRAGAEVSKDYQGRSVLGYAVQNKMYHLVEFILKEDNPKIKHPYTYENSHCPLSAAVFNKDMRMIRLLLDYKTEINKTADGWLPLHTACHYGDIDIVKFLIERGADVNARGRSKLTALHFAASAGRYEICELLLSEGAKTEAQNHDNETPLVLAAKGKHEMVVWLLLREGMKLGVDEAPPERNGPGYF